MADVRPRVTYRTIQVGPIFFEKAPADDDIVQIPGAGLALSSSDNDFYPLVRLEVWDGPATKPNASWEYERSFSAPLADSVTVVDLGGATYGAVAVHPGVYHIRVMCRGRDHLEAPLALDPFPPSGPHEDPLEIWVIQMWPAS
jgi:hypothetical protein